MKERMTHKKTTNSSPLLLKGRTKGGLSLLTYLTIFILTLPLLSHAEWTEHSIRGYIRETPIVWDLKDNCEYEFVNLLHNRLNFRWYPHRSLTAGVELKSRLYAGESVGTMQQSIDAFSMEEQYLDWRRNFIEADAILLSAEIDRFWIDAYYKDLQATIGKQRIAWGTNLVRNPIDIFNPASPLDFDNEEKPGTDAVRIQYYTSPFSKIEIGYAPQNEWDQVKAALKYQTNIAEYDLHVLAGTAREDVFIGGAWAGNIMGGGFRGELLATIPDENEKAAPQEAGFEIEDDAFLIAALSGDYTFRNTLYLHCEVLYNSAGTTGKAGGAQLLKAWNYGWLSPARLSIFGETAKDLTPLLRGTISGIVNPCDKSYYLGPILTYSAAANLDLTVTPLLFFGENGAEYGDYGNIYLVRGKWSF